MRVARASVLALLLIGGVSVGVRLHAPLPAMAEDGEGDAAQGDDTTAERSGETGGAAGAGGAGGSAGAGGPAQETTPDDLGYVVPPRPADASEEVLSFYDTAERAVRRVFDDADSDTAILLSLQGKLAKSDALSSLRDGWNPLLQQAIDQGDTLVRLHWPMGRLRIAFAKAYYDREEQAYKGIDMVACREAFEQVREIDATLMKRRVAIPKLGLNVLEEIELLCRDSHAAALIANEFPRAKGPKRLRNQVKKMYMKAFRKGERGLKVRQVAIIEAWTQEASDPTTRRLRAVVGVKRKRRPPEDPCVMETIVIVQAKKRRRAPPQIVVETTVPIACAAIR